jgi:hypothetical protein
MREIKEKNLARIVKLYFKQQKEPSIKIHQLYIASPPPQDIAKKVLFAVLSKNSSSLMYAIFLKEQDLDRDKVHFKSCSQIAEPVLNK